MVTKYAQSGEDGTCPSVIWVGFEDGHRYEDSHKTHVHIGSGCVGGGRECHRIFGLTAL